MKIWMIESKDTQGKHPTVYYKAVDPEVAKRLFLKDFVKGMEPTEVKVTELTWELFQQVTPDEFMIIEDTGF
jgi:hypothetical protein